MQVYRDQACSACPNDILPQLLELTDTASSVDQCRDLLIAIGEFEAGVTDALCPTRDSTSPLIVRLREATLAGGLLFLAARDGDSQAQAAARASLYVTWSRLAKFEFPLSIRVRPPEGFSQYCLFPEQYLRAARVFQGCFRAERALVVGLRSIGTTLSAVVEASLRSSGVVTESVTLRPHGHPFDRKLEVCSELEARLAGFARTGGWVLVVDEGPGLSGSSLTCVVDYFQRLGARPDRVVLLPAYDSSGDQFVNERARELWRTSQRIVSHFDAGWFHDSAARLVEEPNTAWRATSSFDWAVHPHHGRRRYRTKDPDPSAPSTVWRFAGFGRYGQAVFARASALAEAGFSPGARQLKAGFMQLDWVPNLPANPSARSPATLSASTVSSLRPSIGWLADYFAFRERRFRTEAPPPIEPLLQVLMTNARACLGEQATAALRVLERELPKADRHTVVCDARPFPQDFLSSGARSWKVDAWDHGDDHFFPGPVDIAWDLAAASEELELGAAGQAYLVDRYALATRDASVVHVLPWYRATYLSFRAGYCRLAADSLADETERARFERAFARYRDKLARALAVSSQCVA
ncbi:MAG TPA: hypothetical protein VFQ61_16310 [Polyangiaceae bacterium]|nr:hypothetical protein [Polyangiaceae bacterium]